MKTQIIQRIIARKMSAAGQQSALCSFHGG